MVQLHKGRTCDCLHCCKLNLDVFSWYLHYLSGEILKFDYMFENVLSYDSCFVIVLKYHVRSFYCHFYLDNVSRFYFS